MFRPLPRPQEVTQIDYFTMSIFPDGRLDKRRQEKILLADFISMVDHLSRIYFDSETCASKRRADREWRWKPDRAAFKPLGSELARHGLLL